MLRQNTYVPKVIRTDHEAEPDIVVGGREQLFHLLAEASEIEHTLMCSYLFAAFSLKPGDNGDFTPAQSLAVERWRKAIMNVAIEEMGHLLIVANLTAAIGGRPHFSRPNFPVSPGYFPSGVTLTLSPFSETTLDHFIFLERPTGVELDDGKGFEARGQARDQRFLGLMPSAQDYATVSHLYEAIRANLRALCQTCAEDRVFVGHAHGQIGPDMLDLTGVEYIDTLAAAERSLDLIVEQGEGGCSEHDACHFKVFSGIREELGHHLQADPSFRPAYPVVDSPVMRQAEDMTGKVLISAPEAAQLLDFCNATYGLLLRLIVQAFTKTGDGRKEIIAAAFELMHILGSAAAFLARLPASSAPAEGNAGITFTMLRGIEPFLPGIPEAIIIEERLTDLAKGAAAASRMIPAMPDFQSRLTALADRLRPA